MEKTISVRRTTITFSIWDLGGQREFVNMLPLVCNDAVAILFMFDLSRKSTLNSVKEWYRQARGFNKVGSTCSMCRSRTHPSPQTAIPFLIGTKYDTFATFPKDEQEEITKQVRDHNLRVQERIAQPRTQRQNALPKPCMHRSSSVLPKPRSTYRRYSRSYSPKPSI